jgi:formylglycine-generating enzyme required for sulfatase activity/serine/threonine protein kinase
MPPQDSLNLVGKTIAEKYAIESVVGEGGFAVVYRATHLLWQRPVAIKVFKVLSDVTVAEREKLRDDFLQEGKLLAELSERSAAICQARDVGMLTEEPKLPYMVLEWLEGSSLDAVLAAEKAARRPPRTIDSALRLLAPIAEALALAHRKGVAHRDIKPPNIFLVGDPDEENCPVKLLDFGIAKVVVDAQKAGGAFTKTSGKITSFTPAYGAPEQFSRTYGATGPWTDVFAFALVLVECITQKDPLEGEDFMQIGYASSDKDRRPTPRAKGAQVTDEVERVFEKALAVSPNDRYRTLGEFWEALRTALPTVPVQALTTTDPRPSRRGGFEGAAAQQAALRVTPPGIAGPQPPPGRGKGVYVAGAVAFAFVVGAGLYVAISPSRGDGAVGAPSASGSGVTSASAPRASSVPPSIASAAPVKKDKCPSGMIWIEGGRFFMGSDDPEDLPTERPAHNVTLSPFCIDRFEVTVERYLSCSDNGGCKRASRTNEDWEPALTPHQRSVYDPLCNIRDPVGKAKHPINCVDWEMADTFCHEAGGRLPTEAEWEFSARGPDGRKYPWGDDPPTGAYLNACGIECVAWGKAHDEPLAAMYPMDDGYASTAPVGSFSKGRSRYGVEDVVGNVWEWVADWYEPYAAAAQVDPKGPESGTQRVIRGGGWNGSNVAWVRPSFRYKAVPAEKSHGFGFRCAKSL